MATKRIKDISTTATTFAADDFIALDASSVGTRKMAKASLITQVGANYLEKADNLSDVASKDTSKLNLEVPNVGTAANEVSVNGMLGDLAFQSSAGVVVDDLTVDGQLTAAVGKPMPVNGPSMRFDGVDDEVAFAASVGSPFSFTNGTDDTAFAVAGWCKLASGWNTDQRTLLSKYGSSTSLREWRVYIDTNYRIYAEKRGNGSISGNSNLVRTISNALSDIDDKWMHICVVYPPAGPNSADAFTSAKAYIYVNGKLNVDVQSEQPSGPYVGMTDTAGDVRIGSRQSFDYWDGEIRDVKLFNKELSAAEVKEVYSNGSLGYAESTGAIAYVSDFTGDANSFTAVNGTVAHSTSIGGQPNALRLTVDATTGAHYLQKQTVFSQGKRYRVQGRFYVPTNSHVDGIYIVCGTSGAVQIIRESAPTLNSWNEFDVQITANATGDPDRLLVYALDGNSTTVTDPSGDDVLYIDNIRITQIGSVLDARAEQFDTSTGKLYDLSGNSFVGTQSGGVELRGKKFPVYETGTWTPTVSFGGGSTGVVYSVQLGSYTRIGNQVTIHARIDLTSKGSSNGDFRVTGLPFVGSSSAGANSNSVTLGVSKNWSGLTVSPTSTVKNGDTQLYFFLALSTTQVQDTHVSDTLGLRFSATYEIQ